MSHNTFLTTAALLAIIPVGALLAAEDTKPEPSQSVEGSSEAAATFKAAARMVTLEVVVKNREGNFVPGLKAQDFQVYEQSPSRGKQKHQQEIAAFREVRYSDLVPQLTDEEPTLDEVYTNAVTSGGDPVPPTILLVDGLNLAQTSQFHVQMLRILRSLPTNVPVAVFLLGHRLQMLQDFTTSPRLLQSALERVTGGSSGGTAPADSNTSLVAQLDSMNKAAQGNQPSTPRIDPEMIEALQQFERETYVFTNEDRVKRTVEALISLARHLAGYSGRKNLLWLSAAFPVTLVPQRDETFSKPLSSFFNLENIGETYRARIQSLERAMSEAKVAVYPINPEGVQPPEIFRAEVKGGPSHQVAPQAVESSLWLETLEREGKEDTMQAIADATGGRVCTGNNDLADCVRKAVDDASAFYEIAYYPDWQQWNGEYRTITVKTSQPEQHLSYRRGYFAQSGIEQSPKTHAKQLQQAACEDYLDATSVTFTAKALPPDSPEKLKFGLTINASGLTMIPAATGSHNLSLTVAVCTFDRIGNSQEFMFDPVKRSFDAIEYQSLKSKGLPHDVSIPAPKPAAVRLLVEDVASGRLGSVYITLDDDAAPPAAEPRKQ